MFRLVASLSGALLLLIGCVGCNRECCDDDHAPAAPAPAPTRTVDTVTTPAHPKTTAPSIPDGPVAEKSRTHRKLGIFDAQRDVGKVDPPGTAEFDEASGTYTIKSGGENIWLKHDDFHFVYREMSGDFVFTGNLIIDPSGKNAHRKGCLMIRQDLDADSPYVDVAMHGDGSIALQYRATKGDITANTKWVGKTPSEPARLRIARQGKTFTVLAKTKGGDFETVGRIDVDLKDPVCVGLAVTAHDATATEKVTFSGVEVNVKK